MPVSAPVVPSKVRRPIYHPLVLLRMLVLIVAGVYLVIGAYMMSIQTAMIYCGYSAPVAPEVAIKQAKGQGLVEWQHPTSGATLPQGFVQPDFETAPAPRGTIVFFHGNGEAAYWWSAMVEPLKQRGFRVFLYEYPGYGSRPGVPSEKSIVPDAEALVRDLAAREPGPIYIWGSSLGSGVAAEVCADPATPVKGLILVAPWDTLADVGRSYYPMFPVQLILHDKYDSIANLQNFKGPVCIIRGDKDETIVPSLTLNLFAHLNDPKKMILESGFGHLNWPDDAKESFWGEALDFIAPKKS